MTKRPADRSAEDGGSPPISAREVALPGSSTIALRVQPSATRESWRRDAWRECWVVSVTAPPRAGRANAAALAALVRALGVEERSVRWLRAGTTRDKLALVDGIASADIEARLRRSVRGPNGRLANGAPREVRGATSSE
ncbi:MAG: DUF167 family protein [Thermoplasmata archaeon]